MIRAPRAAFSMLAAGALAALGPAPVYGLEILAADSSREGKSFTFSLEARLDAPMERVVAVLSDYGHLHELHQRMASSRVLGEPAPGVVEVYTEIKGCVAVFCRTLHRVEHIRRTADGLLAEDIPGRSDFDYGVTRWRFAPEGDATRLSYEVVLRPRFWVPPVVGPSVLANSTRRTTIELLVAAERRARGEE